ncbi:hypothetical protein FIBSPDRAFT_876764, partial [Athelia psychrophila]
INTGVHIAPKLRNSASTASKPPTCDLQAVTRAWAHLRACRQGPFDDPARALCLHPQHRLLHGQSAYIQSELLALTRAQPLNLASLTSF